MAVYDAFMFFNEFDLLSVRLAEHDPFVDFFVLVQADRTHAGEPKPLHFVKTDPRFANYAHKIVVVNVPLQEKPESAWINESLQRQAVFSAVDYQPQDIVYLSDVDEIISRYHWKYLLERMASENLIGVWLKMYYYFLNLELQDHPWAMAKIMKAKTFLDTKVSGNEIRCSPAAITTPFPCGWHFSYLMTVEQIIEKISAYGHQENNKAEFKNTQNIERAMRGRKDLFGRNMSFKVVHFDRTWPKEMWKNKKWERFVIKTGLKEWGSQRVTELKKRTLELSKKGLQPLLRPLLKHGNKKDSYNEFGSQTFEKLIAARPKAHSPQEWRRLIEFLEFVLPQIEDGYSANQCAELFIKLVSSLGPNSKVLAIGNAKGRGVIFASRAAAISGSKVIFVPSIATETASELRLNLRKNISLYAADNVVFSEEEIVGNNRFKSSERFDFIFCESSTKQEVAPKYLEGWKSSLLPQGIFFGDVVEGGA